MFNLLDFTFINHSLNKRSVLNDSAFLNSFLF